MKNKSILLSLLSVLALLGAFLLIIFVIVPRISKLYDLSVQVKGKNQQISLKKQEIDTIKQAQAIIKNAQNDIKTLQIAVPDKEKAEEALAQLADATGQAGLSLTSVDLHGAQDGYVKISATVFGPFDKTVSLMSNLESSLRPIRVDDFNINSNQGSSDVSTTVNLSLPFLPSVTASVSPSVTPSEDLN